MAEERDTMEEFIRLETVEAIMAAMIGHTATKRMKEKKKEKPDFAYIHELEELSSQLSVERDAIDLNDSATMDKLIEKYAPVLRKEYEETEIVHEKQ